MPFHIAVTKQVVAHVMTDLSTNAAHTIKENKMNWVHHHDPEGISDYPNELPFDTRMPDYWTNDADVRIGFYGHARGIATFTYKKGDLNFIFRAVKGGQETENWDEGDFTLGPICSVFIERSRQKLVNGTTMTDPRDSLFEGVSLPEIMNDIKAFMLIYRDPRFPSPIAIENVTFPFGKA